MGEGSKVWVILADVVNGQTRYLIRSEPVCSKQAETLAVDGKNDGVGRKRPQKAGHHPRVESRQATSAINRPYAVPQSAVPSAVVIHLEVTLDYIQRKDDDPGQGPGRAPGNETGQKASLVSKAERTQTNFCPLVGHKVDGARGQVAH